MQSEPSEPSHPFRCVRQPEDYLSYFICVAFDSDSDNKFVPTQLPGLPEQHTQLYASER